MPGDVPKKGWLAALVASELERHDPAAALRRLPSDVRDAGTSAADLAPAAQLLVARSLRRRHIESGPPPAADALEQDVRLHLALLLDLALLRGEPFDGGRRRSEMAAFLAAALGLDDLALAVHVERPGGAPERATTRALRGAEHALEDRFFPPGDPRDGLPLHPGRVAVLRRRLARVAMGFHRHGKLETAALARHAQYAAVELVLLAEAMAGLLRTAGPMDSRMLVVRQRQLARLGLPRPALREARRAVADPRGARAIAHAAPERVRPFLVEQLHLAVLRARLSGAREIAFVEEFSAATRLDGAALGAARVEAAAQHADHHVWFEAFEERPQDWAALADEWESTADLLVERVSAAVTDNLGAIVTEIRQTGELGQLLAKAAAGRTLSADEKRKVRKQLLDVAKAVPALAIFAAPGGLLLLPLLAKLLPFNLLPSAWDKPPAPKGRP